ncbi:hypothetical protein [Slackia heliotrinireducens]|uniref:hypothetical protein n=1 Tax=Slackia heliotrinireducens TaxID=84110 RepID=UPI003314C03B
MKRIVTLLCTFAMALTLGACSSGAGEEAVQEEPLSPADQLLVDVSGTYDELFTVICDPQYDQLWLEDCEALVGPDMAADAADMLKSACTGTIYGDEAAAAYADDPEAAQFDCYFINGPAQITFDGNTISGVDANGNEVFSHEYAYVQDLSLDGMMDGYLYATEDADAGEFKYFFMMPDTPGSTYHIEFRYGSDIDALTHYAEGPYAYWLAAGILTDADDQMIEDVIGLFCEENLADQGEQEAQAA